jgi:hypothetical protein
MRRVKWASTSWLSAGRIRRDRFLRLLSNEQTKALFDDVFIRGVEDRKNALDARQLKIVGLQFPIFMFLLFTLIPINVPISILGISPSGSQGLREIVLLVWASLATYASLVSIEQNSLRDILLAFVSHRASGSSDAQEVLKLRYGLSQLWMAEPADDHIVRSRVWALVATACIIGVLILLFMLGLILVGTPLLVLFDVYRHPAFSPPITAFVITYVIVSDVVGISIFLIFFAWFPYRNQESLMKLVKLLMLLGIVSSMASQRSQKASNKEADDAEISEPSAMG